MSTLRGEVNCLLRKIKEGNKTLIEDLYFLTANHLKVVAYQYLVNKDDVEDVMMEICVRVQTYINSFNPTMDGYNWLCKMAEHVAFDLNRSHKNNSYMEKAECVFQIDDEMIRHFQKDEILRVMKNISPEKQQLMYFRHWLEYSLKDIAKLMSMKKSNVHKKIKKCEKEIKKILENGGKNEI